MKNEYYMYYQRNKQLINQNLLQDQEEKYKITEEEKAIDKVHDKMFRDILNNRKEFVGFINNFLSIKEELKSENVELYKRSYITKQYKEKISDVVYRTKNKDTYYIIEHQTKNDYRMLSRMLNYTDCIIEDIVKTKEFKETKKYPKIIPIVIYTGYEKWKAEKKLKVHDEYLKTEIEAGYNLIDINKYSKEFLVKKKTVLTNAMLIEKSKNLEQMIESLEEIVKNIDKDQREDMIKIIDKVVRQYMENDKIVNELLERIKGREVVGMTPLAYGVMMERRTLREEGRIEGKVEGKVEGRKTEKINIAKRLLKENMSIEFVKKVTGLKIEEIEKISNKE